MILLTRDTIVDQIKKDIYRDQEITRLEILWFTHGVKSVSTILGLFQNQSIHLAGIMQLNIQVLDLFSCASIR